MLHDCADKLVLISIKAVDFDFLKKTNTKVRILLFNDGYTLLQLDSVRLSSLLCASSASMFSSANLCSASESFSLDVLTAVIVGFRSTCHALTVCKQLM